MSVGVECFRKRKDFVDSHKLINVYLSPYAKLS